MIGWILFIALAVTAFITLYNAGIRIPYNMRHAGDTWGSSTMRTYGRGVLIFALIAPYLFHLASLLCNVAIRTGLIEADSILLTMPGSCISAIMGILMGMVWINVHGCDRTWNEEEMDSLACGLFIVLIFCVLSLFAWPDTTQETNRLSIQKLGTFGKLDCLTYIAGILLPWYLGAAMKNLFGGIVNSKMVYVELEFSDQCKSFMDEYKLVLLSGLEGVLKPRGWELLAWEVHEGWANACIVVPYCFAPERVKAVVMTAEKYVINWGAEFAPKAFREIESSIWNPSSVYACIVEPNSGPKPHILTTKISDEKQTVERGGEFG